MGGFAVGIGGGTSGGAEALSEHLSTLQALRTAAAQQQKLQDQQRLEQFNTEIKLRQDGYQPAENPTGGTLNSGGLGQRNPAPDATPGNTIVDPFGRRWYKPQAAQKPDMTLNEALSKGGQPLDSNGKVFLGNSGSELDPNDPAAVGQSLLDRLNQTPNRVTPPDERVVTVENGKKVYIPDEQETEGNKERVDAAKVKAEHDAQQFTLPDALSSKLEDHAGLPAGTLKGLSVPRSELRALLTSLADKKADAKQLLSGYASKAGNPLQLDKTTGEVSEVQLPAGSKRELTPAQQEAQLRHEDAERDKKEAAQQKTRDAAQKQIDALQGKEQAQHALRQVYGDTLSAIGDIPQGKTGTIVDPDTKKSVTITDANREARRKYYQSRYEKATDLAQIHQSQQRTILRRISGGGPQEPPAANEAPQSKPKQPAKKVAPMSQVQAYAKKHGLSLSDAVKQAKSEGYEVQGQ